MFFVCAQFYTDDKTQTIILPRVCALLQDKKTNIYLMLKLY